jgi:hypothetical protein
MFDAPSGDAIDNIHISLDDVNRRQHIGSAFNDGFYSHVNKDLRQVLGQPVVDPWSRTYCGGGVLATCRAALWAALEQAADDLEAEFGSPNVADWKRAIADEDVRQTAVGVTTVPAIHWINRPTFQQVVQIESGACARRHPTAGSIQSRASSSSRTGRPTRATSSLAVDQKGAATASSISESTRHRLPALYLRRHVVVDRQDGAAGGLLGDAAVLAGRRPASVRRPRALPWREAGAPRAGVAGKSRIIVKGKGELLDVPDMPVATCRSSSDSEQRRRVLECHLRLDPAQPVRRAEAKSD